MEPDTFTCNDVGTNNVVFTVTDLNGNISQCNAIVTVKDSIPPLAKCHDITIQLDEAGNASIAASQADNGSSDNCGISSMTVVPDSFNCTDVGPNNAILTVVDINGNISQCDLKVTVEDTIPPTVQCKNITISLDSSGNAGITAAQINNGSHDNCGISSMKVSPNAFTCSDIGENTVSLEVTDIKGNMSANTAIITIVDDIPPTVDISSPKEITYYNTQESLPIIYSVADLCDPYPQVKAFLDGETITKDSLYLGSYLGESGHTLKIQASDTSGNVGEDSVLFDISPEPMKSILIKEMQIQWAHDKAGRHRGHNSRFTILGSFELPDEYPRAILDKSAILCLYIRNADQMGKDKVAFKEFKTLWLYHEPFSKNRKTDDGLGEGIDIETMYIHWLSEVGKPGHQKKKVKKNEFYIVGAHSFGEIDLGALPREAIVTLEIPVAPYEEAGSLVGKETIEFKKSGHIWNYHPRIKHKN